MLAAAATLASCVRFHQSVPENARTVAPSGGRLTVWFERFRRNGDVARAELAIRNDSLGDIVFHPEASRIVGPSGSLTFYKGGLDDGNFLSTRPVEVRLEPRVALVYVIEFRGPAAVPDGVPLQFHLGDFEHVRPSERFVVQGWIRPDDQAVATGEAEIHATN